MHEVSPRLTLISSRLSTFSNVDWLSDFHGFDITEKSLSGIEKHMMKKSSEKAARAWVLALTSVASFIVGGLLLQAGAFAWIGLIARPGLAYPELVAPLIIAGFGASAIPAGQNAVVSSVAANEIGKASGAFNMLRQLGAAFGVAILAAVFAGVGSFGSAQAFSNGFAPAMGVSAALSLVGAIAGLLLPGRRDMAFVRTTTQAPGTREHEPYGLPEQSPSR